MTEWEMNIIGEIGKVFNLNADVDTERIVNVIKREIKNYDTQLHEIRYGSNNILDEPFCEKLLNERGIK